MNATTCPADAVSPDDDADLVIHEFDRPTGGALELLGFSVHCGGGAAPGLPTALVA